jgi:hypothetical protein
VFGVLERFWSGAILDSVEAVLGYASNMTYNKKKPFVKLINHTYEKKIKVSKKELKPLMDSFNRSLHLPKWYVMVMPNG